ncbi:TetR/AcrR family transcriptional regulator [Nostoc sp. UCD121]|uniref:TetR/AcrR family transcriptional regulator n=1 Tax=unclassified Nostoc TaxID=2593658 RepID=UPI0016271692|nr:MULTISPECIES: TetR/AcrR family transcriptional regulator [unclassified Nostoc]MBC1224286.1 TetR/AcrR family transcriptional regulator [Nostoc sp. UCD120]MBC1279421.1 TetR/AcrR family transcriptional regulator [Nostoc sp. UCD121]MBC1296931.1 TetR/AcrR family transcriptional regulator [Nostoc sp. UCD122]
MPKTSGSQPETLSRLRAMTQKQEQILQGAMQVFLIDGYAGTSMDRVSAEAGVSKQTIYSHFQDKEGLFKALIERVTIASFQGIFCTEDLHGEPTILLREIAETYLTKVAENPEYLALFRLIITESQRFPELAKLYTQTVIQRGRLLLSQYLASHPELGISDPEATAQIFFGSLVSYVMVQEMLYGKEMMPLSRDRILDSLMSFLLAHTNK